MKMSRKQKNIIFVMALVMLWTILILFGVKSNNPDNDMYFLASTGRYIVEHGIPEINPFCIDEGLKIIVQQWVGSIIDYLVINNFGNTGVFFLACFYMVVETIVMCVFLSNYTKSRQVLFFALIVSAVSQLPFYNTRGSIVTSCIILMEVFCLTRYGKSCNKKYLLCLPFASLFLINWQSSAWPMMFVYILPFLVPDKVSILNTGIIKHYKEQSGYYLSVLAGVVVAVLCGFVNPYGPDGMMYIFYSGSSLEGHVHEFTAPEAGSFHLAATVVSFASLFIYMTKKKGKSDVRMVLLCLGSIILSCTMKRNVWYGILALPSFALVVNDLVRAENWKAFVVRIQPPSKVAYGFLIGYMTIFIVFVSYLAAMKPYSGASGKQDTAYTPLRAVEYLDSLDNKEDITVLSSFNNGGFFEWNGYKVYLDARPEIYNSRINGKKDIYDTYIDIIDGRADYSTVLEEYQFSHIFVECGSPFYYYMKNNTGYVPVVDDENSTSGYQFYEKIGFNITTSVKME